MDETESTTAPVDSTDLDTVLRAGWVARGMTYLGAGVIALSIVIGHGGAPGEPSQQGAISLAGSLPGGRPLLFVFAIGLAMFALWELVTVFREQRTGPEDWIVHLGKLCGVVFYGALGFSALQGSLGRLAGGRSLVDVLSRTALGYPLGRLAVAAAGAIVCAVAVRRAIRVWTGRFADSYHADAVPPEADRAVRVLGRIGEIGRSLGFLLIGFFLIVAAWRDNPNEADGLGHSLFALSGDPSGRYAVAVIGIGFAAYGLFCVGSAPARRLPNG